MGKSRLTNLTERIIYYKAMKLLYCGGLFELNNFIQFKLPKYNDKFQKFNFSKNRYFEIFDIAKYNYIDNIKIENQLSNFIEFDEYCEADDKDDKQFLYNINENKITSKKYIVDLETYLYIRTY